MVIHLADEHATRRLGGMLAEVVRRGDLIALDGPLGAGKTTLVRSLVEHLGGDPTLVASPTFTLLNRYDARLPIVHVDAYRLQDAAALAGLGFDELADEGLGIIEWSQRVAAVLSPAHTWRIDLEHDHAGRSARVAPPDGRTVPWLQSPARG
jgi:hypothetical protein